MRKRYKNLRLTWKNTMEKTLAKNILFDLDGTVLDTLPDLVEAANYALVKSGFPAQTFEDVRRAIGHGIRNLLRDLMRCDDQEILESCRLIFKEYYDKNKAVRTRPYEGLIELIKSLKARGIRVFVISNKYDDAAKDLIKTFYGELFDGVYGSCEDIPPKPDRAIFDKVCEQNGLDSKECIYVGDSEVDVQFAANCGMEFIAVSWGFRTKEELIASGAKRIASDIQGLKTNIEEYILADEH